MRTGSSYKFKACCAPILEYGSYRLLARQKEPYTEIGVKSMDCQCTRKQARAIDEGAVSAELLQQTDRHPCYSLDAHHKYARMHLPVAPVCNISCNYCNRKYDCVNESRPGVTSEVLTPWAALEKFSLVREKLNNLSVVGIAGPGDALANWNDTRETIKLIKQSDPGVIFCLSTNGLLLPDHAGELVGLGVRHVTVTVNCLDPETGSKIYKFINYKGKKYEGSEAAGILINNQLAGIQYLTAREVMVKVNIVMMQGVNDTTIPDVVKKAKELGVFITNIMPLIPAPDSAFEDFPRTGAGALKKMRDICQLDLRQMYHCRQCRADAIGLLGEDISQQFRSAEVKDAPSVPKAV